jgi:hypothetical protein
VGTQVAYQAQRERKNKYAALAHSIKSINALLLKE